MTGHPTDDFPRLLSKFENLIEVARCIPFTEENAWKAHGQLLLIKAYCHLRSIALLAGPAMNTDMPTTAYLDHGSIAVLSRSAYETYVLFSFIFLEPDPGAREFRHQVWRLSGLMSRSKLNRPKAFPPERLEQIMAEEQESSRLKEIVTSSTHFAGLDDRTQRNVRKGEGVRLGIALIDLAVNAGLPRQYASDMYTHFCNYSHAGAISIFQISETLNNGTSLIMVRANVAFCCILLTRIILAYTEFFEVVDSVVAEDSELTELLAIWQDMGESFGKMY